MLNIPFCTQRGNLYYLAAPYSHERAFVMHDRAARCAKAFLTLAERGYFVYSPILHGHPTTFHGEMHYNFWIEHGLKMLSCCDCMIIFMLPGWRESKGIEIEAARAQQLNLPVLFLDPTKGFVEDDTAFILPVEAPL